MADSIIRDPIKRQALYINFQHFNAIAVVNFLSRMHRNIFLLGYKNKLGLCQACKTHVIYTCWNRVWQPSFMNESNRQHEFQIFHQFKKEKNSWPHWTDKAECCHILFMHVFYCITLFFSELTLLESSCKVSFSKMYDNAENTCTNRKWQLALYYFWRSTDI